MTDEIRKVMSFIYGKDNPYRQPSTDWYCPHNGVTHPADEMSPEARKYCAQHHGGYEAPTA